MSESIKLQSAAGESSTRLLRCQDISFVIDALESGIPGMPPVNRDRTDFTNTGIAGHSFDAFTALTCLGAALTAELRAVMRE